MYTYIRISKCNPNSNYHLLKKGIPISKKKKKRVKTAKMMNIIKILQTDSKWRIYTYTLVLHPTCPSDEVIFDQSDWFENEAGNERI